MALILFDTNIFVDMLNGAHQATVEVATYDVPGTGRESKFTSLTITTRRLARSRTCARHSMNLHPAVHLPVLDSPSRSRPA